MSSKHTPGPWEIEKVSGGWGVRAPNWGYVAIHNTSGLPHWDEGQEANRRLIAAAPDLLIKLTGLIGAAEYLQARVVETRGADCMDNLDVAIDEARTAIAKATGGAQ